MSNDLQRSKSKIPAPLGGTEQHLYSYDDSEESSLDESNSQTLKEFQRKQAELIEETRKHEQLKMACI
ncbi:uncharacterized protein MONOS_1180 [Monocercomonoides exilis]|uniref:uncharacterized protein n=1 Tax=Monocercomonoides exilis TaxID=2049356 RepID=UPI00355ABC8B|nr:hypothetical protein MONOS_1180 [Monocercomonoides exilis]|eukprot:MONOS_1180.1-p1 / transcript=MONOS_1180.1 / gene=MONOS_1180 / organism=Monocercomonoides_exilis_PA203 / gene_product=unspecified product / transcript_product=unspecified product / location=Mono_scaffold00020:56513-56790(-) / protein_length=68 / sequence_SO=supercontig / SO=protein_coding / is_pseudo=false